MIWNVRSPHGLDDLGYLPVIFIDDDERPAVEQANDRYAHGGGWRPQQGWKLDLDNGTATYPGDPPLHAIAFARLRDETLVLFPYGYVAVVQKDGGFEMARMD